MLIVLILFEVDFFCRCLFVENLKGERVVGSLGKYDVVCDDATCEGVRRCGCRNVVTCIRGKVQDDSGDELMVVVVVSVFAIGAFSTSEQALSAEEGWGDSWKCFLLFSVETGF